MSDRLTLSCWLRGYHPLNRLSLWEKLLATFPFSRLSQRQTTARILAVNYQEPVQFERAYPVPFDPAEVVPAYAEFNDPDTAWQLDAAWDLMKFDEQWSLGPVPVTLWCFGSEFENELADHMRVEFGLEDSFLPQAESPESYRPVQANLISLTRLVNEITRALPMERKHLWSESGINFAERLKEAVSGEEPSGLTLQ